MAGLKTKDVLGYVEKNIGVFHEKRISSLDSLNLNTVLRRKNPYLFRAKNLLTSEAIVKGLIDAHISSNEETIFGDWLEGLAIFINEKAYKGWKSGIKGIDLEFDKEGSRHIVSIKSGPNWGNSSQISKMRADFLSAQKTLRTSNSKMSIVCVNGCCYGRSRATDKGDYFKYCGQEFWRFISGREDLYTEIIEPLGHKAKERNDDFMATYAARVNVFTLGFSEQFCHSDGTIDWDGFVKFNSSSESE